jgi:hypothetical protein
MRHEHTDEAHLAPSRAGSVLADIGGEVGAAVLHVPATLRGLEIEVRPVGAEWDGTHTAVRERHVNGTVIWAAFFGSLIAGCYELRVRGDATRIVEIEVVGGEVADATW